MQLWYFAKPQLATHKTVHPSRRRSKVRKVVATFLIVVGTSMFAWAATPTGTSATPSAGTPQGAAPSQLSAVSGKVLDPSGAVVTSADVTLTNTATGAVIHKTSDV